MRDARPIDHSPTKLKNKTQDPKNTGTTLMLEQKTYRVISRKEFGNKGGLRTRERLWSETVSFFSFARNGSQGDVVFGGVVEVGVAGVVVEDVVRYHSPAEKYRGRSPMLCTSTPHNHILTSKPIPGTIQFPSIVIPKMGAQC